MEAVHVNRPMIRMAGSGPRVGEVSAPDDSMTGSVPRFGEVSAPDDLRLLAVPATLTNSQTDI